MLHHACLYGLGGSDLNVVVVDDLDFLAVTALQRLDHDAFDVGDPFRVPELALHGLVVVSCELFLGDVAVHGLVVLNELLDVSL